MNTRSKMFVSIVCTILAAIAMSYLLISRNNAETAQIEAVPIADEALINTRPIFNVADKAVQKETVVELGDKNTEEETLDYRQLMPEGYPKSFYVPFPNGEGLSVSYKLMESRYSLVAHTRKNTENYINIVSQLAKDGHDEAANAAFTLLGECTRIPRDPEMARIKLDRFQQTGEYIYEPEGSIYSNLKHEVGSYSHSIETTAIEGAIKLCKNVSAQQIEERHIWRERAIELGNRKVLIDVAMQLGDTDPQKQFKLYQRAWDFGFVDVATNLAMAYEKGVPISATERGKPDLVTSYAYTLAQAKVLSGILQESTSPNASNLLTNQDSGLSHLASRFGLTPQEHIEAQKLAAKLIKNNDKCCVGFWENFSNR